MVQTEGTVPSLPNMGPDPRLLAVPAALMAAEEDLIIFRRFDEINILNLLILQDQTQELIKQFRQLCPESTDQPAPDLVWYLPPNPLARRNPSSTQGDRDTKLEEKRRELWQKLKEKLKEYNASLLEMANLRGLEPPNPSHVKRLRHELNKLTTRSLLPNESIECWDPANDDDFAMLYRGVDKGSRVSKWIKLGIGMLKWELWGHKQAHTSVPSGEHRVIKLGKKGPRVSKVEMARKHAFVSRFVMALFGGIALIVPTVIMVKVEGINLSLITTSVAVLLFGLALAFGATDSTGKDVLTATAAYTAVLVVFVGASLDGGSSSAEPQGASNSASSGA